MNYFRIVVLMLYGWALLTPQADDTERATITVVVSTAFGAQLDNVMVSLTAVGPKKRVTATGGEAKFDQVPFGLYDLEAQLPGFVTRKERIRVYQRRLRFRLSLDLAPTHSYERPELVGSISGDLKDRSDLWVRLVPIYGSDLIENKIDEAGNFELAGMAPGRYVILVLQKDKILKAEPVEVLARKQVIRLYVESTVNRN